MPYLQFDLPRAYPADTKRRLARRVGEVYAEVIQTVVEPGARPSAQDGRLTVLNPQGFPPRVTPKDMAPRLDTLEGKTVYLVDCRFDDADLFLRQMQDWFREHLPGVH